jgi:tyrosyl-tRNA synthetase
MLQKESVKSRMTEGISYTEFSYMLLQAYDFLHLFRTRGCELQLGGSDQWGNITAGIELIRRTERRQAHGVSAPLITTPAGTKFGKSEAGSVWLDPELTSPYWFYQFWINADDHAVEEQLKLFTFKTPDEIAALGAAHADAPEQRVPHKALAWDVTARVHSPDVATRVAEASSILFGDLNPREAAPQTWQTLAGELDTGGEDKSVELGRLPMSAFDLVWSQGYHTSKGELRRLFQQSGIQINRRRVSADSTVERSDVLPGNYIWIRQGKKHDRLIIVQP